MNNKLFMIAPPSGTNKCLTMWLDSGRAEGSWLEWSCTYRPGYASLCKKPYKSVPSSGIIMIINLLTFNSFNKHQ